MFVDTDEKLNEYHHHHHGRVKEAHGAANQTLDQCQVSSGLVGQAMGVSLGPNLNMQVNAIGSLRRRKRAADKKPAILPEGDQEDD